MANNLKKQKQTASPFEFDATGNLKTTLGSGDIQIGAVELKDATTDDRSSVIDGASDLVSSALFGLLNRLRSFNGTVWERVRSGVTALATSASTGRLNVIPFMWEDSGGGGFTSPIAAAGTIADNSPGRNDVRVHPTRFNRGTYDRTYGNIEEIVFASAARVASTFSTDITNFNGRGVRVRINVTAIVGAPSITIAIQEKDFVSGNYIDRLVSAAITTTGQKTSLTLYPGVTVAANVAVSEPLPRTFRINSVHANADSITYSVDAAIIE